MTPEAQDPPTKSRAPGGQDAGGAVAGADRDGPRAAGPGAQEQARELVQSVQALEVDPPPPDR